MGPGSALEMSGSMADTWLQRACDDVYIRNLIPLRAGKTIPLAPLRSVQFRLCKDSVQ